MIARVRDKMRAFDAEFGACAAMEQLANGFALAIALVVIAGLLS